MVNAYRYDQEECTMLSTFHTITIELAGFQCDVADEFWTLEEAESAAAALRNAGARNVTIACPQPVTLNDDGE